MNTMEPKDTKEMRSVFVETLIDLAKTDDRIVLLDADLGKAGATGTFAAAFPERHLNAGVAEANMVGLAAGLASTGKIPFAQSFACFASRRVFDQFFISAAYAQLPVKLVGTDPGVGAAFNGGTHMPFEDLGLMRMVPGLPILEPSDPRSCQALLQAAAHYAGPVYIRLYRKPLPFLYGPEETFELGKAKVLKNGPTGSVVLLALGGIMVQEALKAAALLEAQGTSVTLIDVLSLKPLDRDLILAKASGARAVVTCENHQIHGALGSAVAELMAEQRLAIPFARVGIRDQFGEVGTEQWLKEHFKLNAESIVDTVKSLL